jgi:hypothetical protein
LGVTQGVSNITFEAFATLRILTDNLPKKGSTIPKGFSDMPENPVASLRA